MKPLLGAIFILAFATACATVPVVDSTPEEKAVQITENSMMTQGCKLLGHVEGADSEVHSLPLCGSGWAPLGARCTKGVNIRTEAVKKGGNLVLVQPTQTSKVNYWFGEAYSCSGPPK